MAMLTIDRAEVVWRLKMLRSWADVTLREVEEATGVKRSTLSRIEAGSAVHLDYGVLGTLAAYYSAFTTVPVRLQDLLDPYCSGPVTSR